MRSFFRTIFSRRSPLSNTRPPPNDRPSRSTSSAVTMAAAYVCAATTPAILGAAPDDSTDKLHHVKNGRGFCNPWESYLDRSAWEMMSLMSKRALTGKFKRPDTTPPTVPVHKPTFLSSRNGHDALRATWLGHACYFVEFPSGLRVLFDPVFEDRCSPFSFMGPKRYTPKPCDLSDIPEIDVVVISHSHYDHLSHPTVLEIQKRYPNVQFAAPKGLKKWFNDIGIQNAIEFDWWEDADITLTRTGGGKADEGSTSGGEIKARISCLPCQHTSARTLWDKSHTLWASWAVASGGKSVYFGGDTGYRSVPELPADVDDYGPDFAHLPTCPAFKQIGELRGPFDLGLIPIGAYDPRWIMSPMHANPFDSVEIFQDTRCKRAMGIHWGTWVLTEEDVMEPPRVLKAALKRKGLPEEGVFDVCDIGESRDF